MHETPGPSNQGSGTWETRIGLETLRELAEESGEPLDSTALEKMRLCIESLDRAWRSFDRGSPEGDPRRPSHPERLGKFKILGELGRGGFGVVFLAEDPVLGRKLALKVPRLEVCSHREAWRRFLIEAKAASRLDHANVVPVLETGEAGPVGYIASVYVDGPSLETWLARRAEPVPPRLAARLVATLARAIDHAHQRGILHRDLKPANVLLQLLPADERASEDGDRDALPFTPRICDFGLAKLMEAEAEESQSIFVAGSPPYMAPEQAEGRKADIGPATDVYGLGAILYELLTGRPPFRGNNNLEILKQVVAEEPVPLRQVRPAVPRDLETICLKCLAKKPGRRYATAAALADDLERLLEGRPIQARPVSSLERAWKWGRRHPALASLLVFMLLAGAASMVGVVVLQRSRARLARALSEQEDLVATYRVRQAQQAIITNDLEQGRELLRLAAPADGPAGARGFAWNFLRRELNGRLRVLEGHAAPVTCLGASPDGRTLASGDESGSVRLWDPETGHTRVLSPAHRGRVYSLSFSPDGRRMVSTAMTAPGEIFLWDVATAAFVGRVVHAGPPIMGQWFTPDGAHLVVLNNAPPNHPHRLLFWDLDPLPQDSRIPDQALLRQLGMTDPRVQAVADLLDGQEACPELARVAADPASRGVAFTTDGSLAVVGSGDGTFQVLSTRKHVVAGVGHFEPSGGAEILYSQGAVNVIRARPHFDHLDRHDRRRHASGPGVTGIFESVFALSPTVREAALGVVERPGLFLVDSQTWQEMAASGQEQPSRIRTVTYLPDGTTVAFGAEDGRIRLWHLTPRQPDASLQGHVPFEAWDVAFSPDGGRLASSGDDGLVRLWDPATGSQIATLRGHRWLVAAVAWSPDGTMLASAGWDNNVRLWDGVSGQLVRVLDGHTHHVRAVAFSPDGRTLASGGDDSAVRLWDTRTGQPPAVLVGHSGNVGGLAFRPDGRTLASGAVDGKVLLWDLTTRQSRILTEGPKVHKLTFSPDGATLAVVCPKAPPRLWDMATGQPRTMLLGHRGDTDHLCFSPDGDVVATAGMDQTVRIWDAASGQELICLTGHQARVNSAAFSPDGRTLASVDHKGAILLWRASSHANSSE